MPRCFNLRAFSDQALCCGRRAAFVVYEVRSKTDEGMPPRTRRSLIAGCVLTSKQSLHGSGRVLMRAHSQEGDDLCRRPSLQEGLLLPAPG